MATILAHIRVNEGKEAQFEEIARMLYERTHATETGVRRYEYWRGSAPRTYYTLLAFDDFRTFIAHQTSPHHEEASPQFVGVFESFRLEWVDPIQGASDLPPTESQDMPADADELTVTYAQRFAADVAAWWQGLR
ncbi:MAG: antibiotic biosynthesis monooxygenase [Ilumatobacteraceae bacterium]|jgi:quinol monooxygenase YgiN|nr:antibiotic biosynthesis monooxygenase [Ilumatobacteraceae bacterium]